MSRPTTLGALRAAGLPDHEPRTVKAELRDNLVQQLRDGTTRFPGIVGFDETVLPALERALLAGHDLVLLGERGQGKTRLIRWSTAARSTTIRSRRCAGAAAACTPSSATSCRWRGGTAASGTARSSPLPTPASAT
jgi:magnesium chelatase subunit I